MTPVLGIFGMLLLASTFDHAAMKGLLRRASLAGGAVLVLVLAVFMADSVGIAARPPRRPGLGPPYGAMWFVATFKLLLGSGILILVALATSRPPEPAAARATRGDLADSPPPVAGLGA